MNRRNFLQTTGLIGSATALDLLAANPLMAQDAAPTTPTAPAEFKLASPPVIGRTSATSTTITWAVSGPSTGWVEYGETEALGSKALPITGGLVSYDDLTQQVEIRGLKANTRYFYRVSAAPIAFKNAYDVKRGEAITSSVGSFTTLNPDGRTASFVIWNDTHDYKTTLQTLHEQTSKIAPDFLFINGDVSNDITSLQKAVSLYLNPYDLPIAQNYPLFFCRGNHDVRGQGARDLHKFVAVPDGQYYYSFRQGPLAVLVMDTGEDKPDSHPVYAGLNDFEGYRTVQQAWLEQEIQKPHFKHAPFRVLFCHIPLWWKDANAGSSCKDARDKWHDLLVKAKIQLVVSGHTHQAFHLPPVDGRPYHQLVGGGPNLNQATLIHGVAEGKSLTVNMRDLTGKDLAQIVLKA